MQERAAESAVALQAVAPAALHGPLAAEIAALLEAGAPDGGEAMGEDQLLALTGGADPPAFALVARGAGGEVVGYAQLLRVGAVLAGERVVVTGPTSPPSRHEVSSSLLDGLLSAARALGGDRLELWVRAAGADDDELAERAGMTLSRRLLQVRRALPLEHTGDPVATRPFRPGVDEAAFLALNARAFAALPDQSGWSLDVLLARERQPWFDPDGFLLHEDAGRLTAFCWTKLHRRTAPLGEIYVIGVDPAAQGRGLGRSMLAAGCEHLHQRGAPEVMLYVDAANVAGRALYDSSGFVLHHEDRCYVTDLSGAPVLRAVGAARGDDAA